MVQAFKCSRCDGMLHAYFVASLVLTAVALAFSVKINLVNNRAGFRDRYHTSDLSKVGCLK